MKDWMKQLQDGEPRAIARALSVVEAGGEQSEQLLSRLKTIPQKAPAHVIGLTGAPGAGKSSLSDELIAHYRKAQQRVAVIAVDPSSPFSGGAVLGDRVRMMRHTLDEGVFIRSMGSRGSLGGLARPVRDAIKVLMAAGFEKIMLETVGVGQSELDVMYVADTVVVVLTPAGGDQVQAAKAGVMETADLLIVNKADLPGAERMKGELEEITRATKNAKKTWDSGSFPEWDVPILLASALAHKGIEETASALSAHFSFLMEQDRLGRRRGRGRLQEFRERLEERMIQEVKRMWIEDDRLSALKEEVLRGEKSVKHALDEAHFLLAGKE